MSTRFGHDFSGVKVHADDRAAASATSIGARAYTFGDHIVFGQGQFTPARRDGQWLLAHELAHVVQQSRRGSQPSAHSDLERAADLAASDVVSTNRPVRVSGASDATIARAPDPSGKNFEGATMITVDLPLGTATPGRSGFEKEARSLLPPNVVENDERWHASHAVGQSVGVERKEGILLAPRGVNLSIQKSVENQINRVRETAGSTAPPGSRLQLKIETGAHPDGARLAFINYELWMIGPDGRQGHMLSASVKVSDDVGRPYVDVAIESSTGQEVSRRYLDAFNAGRQRWTEADKSEPLRPRSSARASYSATTSTLKRNEVPNPEVTQRRLSQPTPRPAATSATPQAPVTQDQAKPPVPVVPAPPAAARPSAQAEAPPNVVAPGQAAPTAKAVKPADIERQAGAGPVNEPPQKPVGPQFQTPSNALEEMEARGGARGAAAVMVLQAVGKALNDIGDAIQRRDAETAFYAKSAEITSMLEKNPGMGVIVEFVFSHTEPLPDSVIAPSDHFEFINVDFASSPQDIHPGIYPGQAGTQIHIVRRWIKPTASARRPAEPAAETRTPVGLQSMQQVNDAITLIRQNAHTSPTTIFLAFKAAARNVHGFRRPCRRWWGV